MHFWRGVHSPPARNCKKVLRVKSLQMVHRSTVPSGLLLPPTAEKLHEPLALIGLCILLVRNLSVTGRCALLSMTEQDSNFR